MLALASTHGSALADDRPSAHACWIERAVIENADIRIFFDSDAPLERSEMHEMVAKVGSILSPLATHHSGCTISVERRDGSLGLKVEAYDALPGLPVQRFEEWIPALQARSP
ncbi:hypothetical protein K9B33_02190 [Sphingobium sp. 3R8]|uniref:hypothetical protein n=1 Tax=Sphingobium sp. 3R8 TaxID=2874921 RepID=UPI001CCE9B0D|nr:hypothetical protein [Sphingobium sp. 3R8]MBZ9646341.1 hypothetical protein [Sphingobium sp. 3R8]